MGKVTMRKGATLTAAAPSSRFMPPWSTKDMRLVVSLRESGEDWDSICRKVGRSEFAVKRVYYKREALLSPSSVNDEDDEDDHVPSAATVPRWTDLQNKLLVNLVEEGQDWSEIGAVFARSSRDCKARYRLLLELWRKPSTSKVAASSSSSSSSNESESDSDEDDDSAAGKGAKTYRWSEAETLQLMSLVGTMPYRDIAKRIGRSHRACIGRMCAIRGGADASNAGVHHPPWTAQEDRLLHKLAKTMAWSEVADRVGRSAKACQMRFTDCEQMSPASGDGTKWETHVPWTSEEDVLLCQGLNRGMSYKTIVDELLDGKRTLNACFARSHKLVSDARDSAVTGAAKKKKDDNAAWSHSDDLTLLVVKYNDKNPSGQWNVLGARLGRSARACAARYEALMREDTPTSEDEEEEENRESEDASDQGKKMKKQPLSRTWTKEMDAKLLRLRDEGMSWERIAKQVGLSRVSCSTRHTKLTSSSSSSSLSTQLTTPAVQDQVKEQQRKKQKMDEGTTAATHKQRASDKQLALWMLANEGNDDDDPIASKEEEEEPVLDEESTVSNRSTAVQVIAGMTFELLPETPDEVLRTVMAQDRMILEKQSGTDPT